MLKGFGGKKKKPGFKFGNKLGGKTNKLDVVGDKKVINKLG
jgi:hypothetical protein